jgi:hypothetical protein
VSAGGDDLEGRKDELYQLRDKSASFGNDLSVSPPPRPTTCLGIENTCNRVKTGKKLRILESCNDTHIVEDCDELPDGSMESIKENAVSGKDTSGREEQQAEEVGKEVQDKRLPSRNQEIFHIQSKNEVKDNESLHCGSTLCINSNAVDYISKKEESQGTDCSERCSNKTSDSCLNVKIGPGNKVIAAHVLNEDDVPEGTVLEILADKSYSPSDHNVEIRSDTRDRSTHFITQNKVVSDSGADENILRVKGGGYGLPSDDFIDMFHTVEEIDKVHRHKSTAVPNENTVFVHKERGRLDKSYSTPAYDLTDCDQRLGICCKTCHTEEWVNWQVSENSHALSSPTSDCSTCSGLRMEEKCEAVSECEEPSKTANSTKSECSDVSKHNGDLYSLEDKQTQRIGEILETINIALLQHRLKEHSDVNRLSKVRSSIEQTDLSSLKTADGSYHENSSTNKDEILLKANKQPCAVSNECACSPNAVHTPLLEDNDNKESEVLVESSFAVSFQEPEAQFSAQICTTRDIITTERVSEVWQKAPVPVVNVKQLQNEEKQHTYIDESVISTPQICVSHVKICVTPPEPPPRPDHPKGGNGMGYRAIMAARSLGKNTNSKNSVVGGGHASFPSPRSLRKRNLLLTSKLCSVQSVVVTILKLQCQNCKGHL